tara:strand:- start:23375 stop:24016 length:642 start_codon:yes stop_codon:yes gene_type:complete
MSSIENIGRRIELVSMDRHFEEISIALYEQCHDEKVEFLVKTYSRVEGVPQRIDFVMQTMKTLGGMNTTRDGRRLGYRCGNTHKLATKRLFLEACKVSPIKNTEAFSLRAYDKKLDGDVTAVRTNNGRYQLQIESDEKKALIRREAILSGLIKLAGLELVNDPNGEVVFPCGEAHDELIGLLLPRALNVRSFLRQESMESSRGQLVAPSAQQE